MSDARISITLSKQEAIVLFELISRLNKNLPDSSFEDQSEKRILMDLEAGLEKNLEEPLDKDYPSILNDAREQVRDKD